jgi:hypothetical protein
VDAETKEVLWRGGWRNSAFHGPGELLEWKGDRFLGTFRDGGLEV